jgi:hypothetical protein
VALRRILFACLSLLLLGGIASARQRTDFNCAQGGNLVDTQGNLSTTEVMQSFPGATVTVLISGTILPAPLYGDNIGTPKSNPFTVGNDSHGFFYTDNSRVDIQCSGAGITVPFAVAADQIINDSTILTLAPQTVPFSATPAFDLTTASWFQITLTGNVTAPTFPNAVAGDILILSITQDGAGNHTWAWPGTFLHPPVIALPAFAVTEMTFKFDGAQWRALAATGDNLQVPGNAVIAGTLNVARVTSLSSNPAQSGFGRLGPNDQLCFRNNALSADVCISKDSLDTLVWNGAGGLNLSGAPLSAGAITSTSENTGFIALTGNVSGGIGTAAGGTLNIQKAASPSAIFMGRAVDAFGTTNAQAIGWNVEQLINPSITDNWINLAYSGELVIPIGNTQNFTATQAAADFALVNYGSGSWTGNAGQAIVGEAWNSGPATSILELDGVAGGCHNGSVSAGIPVQTPTGNGSVTNCRGVKASVSNSSSGTITTAAGVHIDSASNTGGGAITTNIGLNVNDQTVGGTNYAIKTGAGLVSFADNVQVSKTLYATGSSGTGAAAFGTTGILTNDVVFIGGSASTTGSSQNGIQVAFTPSTAGTSQDIAIIARADVPASTTVNTNNGIVIQTPTINSGGAITNYRALVLPKAPAVGTSAHAIEFDGSTSGSTYLDGPATGSSTVITLPALTGTVQVSGNPISGTTLTSTVTTGTAPLTITSTTPVANLTVSNHPIFETCGTTTTCAKTQVTATIILNGGPIALSGGTITITSLPFTSSTSYVCSADDSTGINGIDVVYNSGSSVTFNGTGTDSIRYTCQGT